MKSTGEGKRYYWGEGDNAYKRRGSSGVEGFQF